MLALIAAIFVVLVLAEVLVERHVVLPSFAELERSDARTAMRRIGQALDLRLNGIAVSATDWGNWADTYRFVLDHNSAFIAANISKLALRELNVNTLLIVDLDGRLVQSNDLDLKTDRALRLELTAWRALPADFPWRANLRSGKAAQGLLRTNRGILMLAAAPVLDGNGQGPTRGMVIMGRLLTPAEVQAIGVEAQADLTMLPAMSRGSTDLVETDAVTQVYRGFSDLYGQPIMALRVDVPRRITAQGQQAVALASTCLVIAAVTILVLLMFVLNRVVLNPLADGDAPCGGPRRERGPHDAARPQAPG